MRKQRGAVLVIALIFLLLITAIAASLMTSGSFETVMVANKQIRKDTFHATEAGIEDLLRQAAIYPAARQAGGAAVNVTGRLTPLPAGSGMARVADIQYLTVPGAGPRLMKKGQSLGSGGGYDLYEIRSTVTTADSVTEHVVGIAKDSGLPGNSSPYD